MQVLIERRDLAVTLRIIDEILFTLTRLEAWRRHGIKRSDQLRDYVRRYGVEEFSDAISDVENLVERLGIAVLEDRGSLSEILETMRRCSLMPGDALIAVTAKHFGVDTILTFDEDFRRIPWLKVIP